MIQLTAQMRILVAVEAVDFRKRIDGLAALCRSVLDSDAFSGTVFVFRSRSGKAIRALCHDGQGFWLCENQLSSHYTSFTSNEAPWDFLASMLSARSTSRSHRLQCLVGGFGPGSS